ncbi:hypothetical protein VNO77_41149 [Canavalia gladiata]|uniref:C2H2-type domain-containing protein n=1 Tax=Canavalia gladiata TaxID=3824 RepID=A0AAN9JYP4_CANGL
MERHKCKLCSRTFPNGRALGGHMKAHLATLPLPPKPLSYSSSTEDEDEHDATPQTESDEKALIYGLRENPKKSFRFADPQFSFPVDTGSVVQDRESETESKNPTRRRSKRNRKPVNSELKRPKLSFMESPEQPVSSVSDTSPEEDVAMCLMMLSRDRWSRNVDDVVEEEQVERSVEESKEIRLKRVRGKHHCHNCGKTFQSSRALASHKSLCVREEDEVAGNNKNKNNDDNDNKIFQCPFCSKVFGSGQALGGHKRSHLMPSSSSTANHSTKFKDTFIDLNLPLPPEEDDLSVVSDA